MRRHHRTRLTDRGRIVLMLLTITLGIIATHLVRAPYDDAHVYCLDHPHAAGCPTPPPGNGSGF